MGNVTKKIALKECFFIVKNNFLLLIDPQRFLHEKPKVSNSCFGIVVLKVIIYFYLFFFTIKYFQMFLVD
jgi:hypothetical protein